MSSASPHPLGAIPCAYQKLRAQVGAADWICQGTVVRRRLRRKIGGQWVEKGPYYMWTGKCQGKTVCYALSQAQYAVAKAAIVANRRAMEALAQMQTMTLETILNKVPGVARRK